MGLCAFVAVSAITGCGTSPPPSEDAPGPEALLEVYTVNYPLKYFGERIGGDRVTVELPVPTGIDPASWSPTPDVVAAYQGSDLILLNGADYAKWLSRVTLPTAKLVNTSAGFEDAILLDEAAVTHSHGAEGEHSHAETASTTWLDFTLAARQAEAIRDAFVKARPESESYFRERFEGLASDLAGLDRELEEASVPDEAFLAAAPVYQYFARRTGLALRTALYDPADMTAGDFWHGVEHALEDHRARFILFERVPSDAVRERLDEMGVEVIVFDPCGAEPIEGDFLSVMRANVERLRVALASG